MWKPSQADFMVLVVLIAASWFGQVFADGECDQPPARTDIYTDVGLLGLTVTNLGYLGTSFINCDYVAHFDLSIDP